ncbi:MAG: hypothetical protein AB7T02_08030, partial [Mesotoga sp.]
QDPCLSRKRDVRRIVSPYFCSRFLVSAANVSNAIFLSCSRPSTSNGFLIERLKDVKYEMLLDAANDIHRHFFPNELRDSIVVRLPLAR